MKFSKKNLLFSLCALCMAFSGTAQSNKNKTITGTYSLNNVKMGKQDLKILMASLDKSNKEYILREVKDGVVKTYSSLQLENVNLLAEQGSLDGSVVGVSTTFVYHANAETVVVHKSTDEQIIQGDKINGLIKKYKLQPINKLKVGNNKIGKITGKGQIPVIKRGN